MRRPGVGAGRRGALRAGLGGGVLLAPVNTVAPVLAWTVVIGNSPTITPGTWTPASPAPTYLYTLYRDGVAVGAQTNRTLAQANAYVAVAADIWPSLTWCETATNPAGSATTCSNAVAFDDVIYFNSKGARAIWDAAYKTLSGSDVATITDRSGHNNGLVVLGTAPAWDAAADANFNAQPVVIHDGGTEALRTAAFDFGASVTALGFYIVLRVDTAVTNDRWMSYGTGVFLRQAAGPVAQMARSTTSTATTVMTAAHLVGGTWRNVLDGGDTTALMNGVVEDTDANAQAAAADDSVLSVGSASDGTLTAAITWGYAVATLGAGDADFLSHLRAYTQNRFLVT